MARNVAQCQKAVYSVCGDLGSIPTKHSSQHIDKGLKVNEICLSFQQGGILTIWWIQRQHNYLRTESCSMYWRQWEQLLGLQSVALGNRAVRLKHGHWLHVLARSLKSECQGLNYRVAQSIIATSPK